MRCSTLFHGLAIAGLAGGGLWPAGSLADEGFSRYEVILLRKPFGDAPVVEEAPPPVAVQTEASFSKTLRVCSITQHEANGIKVGIVDAETQKSYVLRIGETDGGITLVSADIAEEQAVLQKGSEVAMIRLGANKGGTTKAGPRTIPKPPTSTTYEQRRQARRDALAKAAVKKSTKEFPKPKYTGEELKKHLQDYNMEVIRNGLPALPIELTAAQDAQLVTEGVLQAPPGSPIPVQLIQAEERIEATITAGGGVMFPAPKGQGNANQAVLIDAIGDVPIDQLTTEELRLLETMMQQQP